LFYQIFLYFLERYLVKGDEQKDGCRCLLALRKSIHHVGLEHCKVQAEKPGNGAEILSKEDCKRYIHLRDDHDAD